VSSIDSWKGCRSGGRKKRSSPGSASLPERAEFIEERTGRGGARVFNEDAVREVESMGNRGDAGVGLRLGESFREEISGDEGGDRKHLQLAERIESKVIQE
jgi:hypothetical protein